MVKHTTISSIKGSCHFKNKEGNGLAVRKQALFDDIPAYRVLCRKVKAFARTKGPGKPYTNSRQAGISNLAASINGRPAPLLSLLFLLS